MSKAVPLGCLVVFLLGYSGLYALARKSHLIVHTRSNTYDAHGHELTTGHDVIAGDGKLASPNPIVSAIFTPLRWVEIVMWHAIEPIGKANGLP